MMTHETHPRPEANTSETMLDIVERVANVGHWRLDVTTGLLFWSTEIYRIHGVAPPDFAPSVETALAFYHPDDVGEVRRLLDHALTSGDAFEFRNRLVTPEGTTRHVYCRGVSEKDGSGVVKALFGTLMDISALRAAEQAARESEMRFRLLAESTSDIITRLDANLARRYVSPVCERVLGFTVAEMLTQHPADLIHPEDRDAVFRSGLKLIGGEIPEGRVTNTYRSRHKNGHYVWIETGMSLAGEGDALAMICAMRDVTARKEAEATIEASEARYRLLAENATDLVVLTDLDLVRTYVSPASRDILGQEPDALVGGSTLDLVHPDDRKIMLEAFRAMSEGLSRTDAQHRVRHADGTWRVVEVACKRVLSTADGRHVGYLLCQRDVTRRQEAERKLRESEALFRALAENTNELIIVGRHDGSRSYISPASTRMLGFTPDEMLAMHVRDLVHPDDIERLFETTRLLGRDDEEGEDEVSLLYRAKTKTGGYIWAEGIFRRIEDARPGDPTIVATFRDVSERVAQAEALAEAMAVAESARAAAELASRAKTDFLASMSHEIRTPLNAVLGYTDLLIEEGNLEPAQARSIERIQSSGAALLTIVDDVLDFSKIEAGQIDLDDRDFALATLVDNTMSIIGGLAAAKGLALTVTVEENLPPFLRGDEDRLRQILLNLLNNAVKFTPAGSVDLRVTGRCDGQSVRLRFDVTDTGIGIPVEKRHRLFQRFSQVDGSIRREYGGTGLGLAIVKSLVDLMGGTIGVAEAPSRGSLFFFEVVFAVAPPPAFAAAPPTALQGAARRRLDVLLVEDLEINRDLAKAVLVQAGHNVVAVGDGADAIDAVRARRFDVVLMDVQMPGMDGMTATKLIRALPGVARMPIIAMTANVLPSQIAEFKGAGMDDHIGKPFKSADLRATLDAWTLDAWTRGRPRSVEPLEGEIDDEVHRNFIELMGKTAARKMLISLGEQTRTRFADERLAGDLRTIAPDAHTMLSAYAMSGFPRFADLCKRLETAVRDGKPAEAIAGEIAKRRNGVAQAINDCAARLAH